MNTAGATAGSEDDEGCCRRKWDAGTPSLTDPPHTHPPTPTPPPSICGPEEDGSGLVGDACPLGNTRAHVQTHVCHEIWISWFI